MRRFKSNRLNKHATPGNVQSRMDAVEAFNRDRYVEGPLRDEPLDQLADSTGTLIADALISPAEAATSMEPTSTDFTGVAMGGGGWEFDGTTYHFVAVDAGVLEAGFNTAGKFLAGVGNAIIDADGHTLIAGASETAGAMIKWKNSSGDLYASITVAEPDPGQWKMYIRVLDSVGSVAAGFMISNDGTINVLGKIIPTGGIKNHWTSIVKTADESRASTTTLANDGELLFTPQASGVYAFRGRIFFNTTAAADFKWRIQAGTVTRLYLRWKYVIPGGTAETVGMETASPTTTISIAGAGTTAGYVEFEGIVTETGTAADVRFQWAQNTSDARNTTVLAGSHISYCLAE